MMAQGELKLRTLSQRFASLIALQHFWSACQEDADDGLNNIFTHRFTEVKKENRSYTIPIVSMFLKFQ